MYLSQPQVNEVRKIGAAITDFVQAVDELCAAQPEVRHVLNTGKPEILCVDRAPRYLFVRPDLIITSAGFAICEVETSPFGLALAEILNRAYRSEKFETLIVDDWLRTYMQTHTPADGTIIYSQKTAAYSGQLSFLADKIFSGNGRAWDVQRVDTLQKFSENYI